MLEDAELLEKIESFGSSDEKGVFLEVSDNFADASGVKVQRDIKWSNPGKIFLSAYSQSERRLLIDSLYSKFKKEFGYYPKSVGAWWIDSYSLNYIEKKYGLSAIMIVADQKSTDSYGVWGQWWGVPYYPSKANVLTPGTPNNYLDAIVLQWAQRDPVLGYGDGPSFSNYSLQANDYIRNGKDTAYFESLVAKYLDCRNLTGQITIGMETGMEASAFQNEYNKQVKVISEIPGIRVITMSEFSDAYKKINPQNPGNAYIGVWQMNIKTRQNEELLDRVEYFSNVSFNDYFIADKESFLKRDLSLIDGSISNHPFPWFFISMGILILFLVLKRKYDSLLWSALFAVSSYGLLFISRYKYGWGVVYGPFDKNFSLLQCMVLLGVVLFSLAVFSKKLKLSRLFAWLIPLSYSLDVVLNNFSYSKIEGAHLLGFFVKGAKFIGLSIGKSVRFILNNFSADTKEAFFRLPLEKIADNKLYYFVLSPIVHIVLAAAFYLLIKRLPKKLQYCILLMMSLLLLVHIILIFGSDPVAAFPVK